MSGISMDGDDFIHLCTNSAQWAAEGDWAGQAKRGRFDLSGRPGHSPSLHWKMAYWLGTEYTAVVLARTFLASHGFKSETVVDTDGDEWVLLTDYDYWAGKRP